MGPAFYALWYLIFCAALVYVQRRQLETGSVSQMIYAVTFPYENTYFGNIWNKRTIRDISHPAELPDWLSSVFTTVTFGEQEAANQTFGNWRNDVSWSDDLGPATIGGFNRIVLIRFTFKKWRTEGYSGTFADLPGQMQAGDESFLDPVGTSANEDTSPVGDKEWAIKGSYQQGGGYTYFVDPTQGKEAFAAFLDDLQADGFFDPELATLTLDMLVLNTNIEIYLRVGWTFMFDFAGNCVERRIAQAVNYSLFDKEKDEAKFTFQAQIVLLVMLALFLFIELKHFFDAGMSTYLTSPGSIVDLYSLLLCFVGLMFYWILKLESEDLFQDFDVASLLVNTTQASAVESLEEAANNFTNMRYVIALNMLTVFIRALFVVATLSTNLGLILNVIVTAVWNLVAFMTMFVLILCGFIFYGFFSFGAGYQPMSEVSLCIIHCFALLTGQEPDHAIWAIAPVNATFFYCLYTIFFLVMVNVFVSILLSAYDLEEKMRQAHGAEEPTVLSRFRDETEEVVSRVRVLGKCIVSCIESVAMPLYVLMKECLMLCPVYSCSICPQRLVGALGLDGRKQRPEDGIGSAGGLSVSRGSLVDGQNPLRSRVLNVHCWLMLFFMALFLSIVQIQTRAEVVYHLSQSTLLAHTEDASWQLEEPAVMEDFSLISSFEGVYRWAAAILPGLHDDNTCAVFEDNDGSWEDLENCSNSDTTQQVVQRLQDWNIGFMSTTFVRLTIQPGCFFADSGSKWASASPLLRQTPDEECAVSDCSSILDQQFCRTSDGLSLESQSDRDALGQVEPISFRFEAPGHLGTYQLLGGFSVNLGLDSGSVTEMLRTLKDDGWFSEKSASMVFDWITYNGNVDMFTLNTVSFSLRPTGELQKIVNAEALNLNIERGGGWVKSDRVAVLVLFSIYIVLTAYYVVELFRQIRSRVKEHDSIVECLRESVVDIWLLSDISSLCWSIASIVLFFQWALKGFHSYSDGYRFSTGAEGLYSIPNDDVDRYNIPGSDDPERPREGDWYVFHEFTRSNNIHEDFLLIAGLNSFFVSIKVVKYVGKMGPVRVFSNTFASGQARNLGIGVTIAVGIAGFALFLETVYGPQVRDVNALSSAFITLFYWMIGVFTIEPFMKVDNRLTVVFFIVYMICFRFIAINTFLATMLNTYAKDEGEAEIQRVKHMVEQEKAAHRVIYPDARKLREDIQLRYEEGSFVVDAILKEDGFAARERVVPELVIDKINNDKKAMQGWRSVEELLGKITVDPKTGGITVVFKKKPKQKRKRFHPKRIAGLKRQVPETAKVRATVHSFWRGQGAIAWVELTAADEVRRKIDVQRQQGGTGLDDFRAADLQEGPEGDRFRREVQARSKEKLNALLFARYVRDLHSGNPGGDDPNEEERADAKSDTDPDELLVELEIEPTGQEVWLDCLVGAIEQEMGEESIIAEVLRTSDMRAQSASVRNTSSVRKFRENAYAVLRGLEHKAKKKYYQHLERESQERQKDIREQNQVIHDYVCELEDLFQEVQHEKQKLESTKISFLKRLAGLLPVSYGVAEDAQGDEERSSHAGRPSGLRQIGNGGT